MHLWRKMIQWFKQHKKASIIILSWDNFVCLRIYRTRNELQHQWWFYVNQNFCVGCNLLTSTILLMSRDANTSPDGIYVKELTGEGNLISNLKIFHWHFVLQQQCSWYSQSASQILLLTFKLLSNFSEVWITLMPSSSV